jgi:hypothetical protein
VSFAVHTAADLQPGDIGFTAINRVGGAAVLAAQSAIDVVAILRGLRPDTAGWITHAFVIASGPPDVTLVEARRGGAVQRPVDYRIRTGFAYARLPMPDVVRPVVGAAAVGMLGVPYGWPQYAAIGGLTLTGGNRANPRGWLAKYVQRRDDRGQPRSAMCSQLVDEAMRQAGVHLFDDGRPAAYVTPGALWWRCAQLGEVWVCP